MKRLFAVKRDKIAHRAYYRKSLSINVLSLPTNERGYVNARLLNTLSDKLSKQLGVESTFSENDKRFAISVCKDESLKQGEKESPLCIYFQVVSKLKVNAPTEEDLMYLMRKYGVDPFDIGNFLQSSIFNDLESEEKEALREETAEKIADKVIKFCAEKLNEFSKQIYKDLDVENTIRKLNDDYKKALSKALEDELIVCDDEVELFAMSKCIEAVRGVGGYVAQSNCLDFHSHDVTDRLRCYFKTENENDGLEKVISEIKDRLPTD